MTPMRRQGWRKWINARHICILLGLLFLVNVIFTIEVSQVRRSICSICGSHQSEVEWIGGFKGRQTFQQSRVDVWMSQNAGSHSHNWQYIGGSARGILGNGIRVSSGARVPPIITSGLEGQQFLLQKATPAQVRSFMEAMKSGSTVQQEQAVDAFVNAFLASTSKPAIEPTR